MSTSDDSTAGAVTHANAPSLLALQILEKLLVEAIRARTNVTVAQTDLRAAKELRQRLERNPRDAEAISWVRQIALRWSGQLRSHALRFRHLFDHLDLATK